MRLSRQHQSLSPVLTAATFRDLDGAVVRATDEFEFQRSVLVGGDLTAGEFKSRVGGRIIYLSAPLARAAINHTPMSLKKLCHGSVEPEHAIIGHVLDGVLGIEYGSEFVHGAKAIEVLIDGLTLAEPRTHLEHLSAEALFLAAWRTDRSVHEIADQLYRHNTFAASPLRVRRFQTARGSEALEAAVSTSDDQWRFEPNLSATWLVWHRRGTSSENWGNSKIYVSLDHELLAEKFASVTSAVMQTSAKAFKVGRRLHDLLRPDKMVIYFASWGDLLSATESLCAAVEGQQPQGVPFTGQLDAKGTVSCGLDPAKGKTFAEVSWRHRISYVAAWALHMWGRAPAAALRANEFALLRLSVDGVDAGTFMPTRREAHA